ncbi:MAG TPA: DUF4337 domain-containing protein [Acidiphilium sp.]|uniref:DUF4337 domain-containing protein n=1 Tax=unclassified Acidiphilium TaxID=2617493 RepID=UPI000BCE7B47|nr:MULTISPECIES: DUF4337 domain-containing protein [unclassified Acidiphilium]OYV54546.1 MAG: hypothetical protein B7Z76_14100 [Acidiphilium sp. 20-67-58]HQT62371.1 DUF4337 domain-containing protein [Acidiphilium sp.]HQU11696.1 DUF4337 domain-containing protein [Acidiphilium sp.]
MDGIETATDSLERHKHLREHPENRHARRMALLIGILAAGLAICEMGEKSAQNDYIAKQIAVNDTWSFYQAKAIKADIATAQAQVLKALSSNSADPALATAARAAEARAQHETSDPDGGEGKAQLKAQAEHQTEARDHQLERYHQLEVVVGLLQIAIVLASVSVVTEVAAFGLVAVLLGGLSFLGGVVVMAFI